MKRFGIGLLKGLGILIGSIIGFVFFLVVGVAVIPEIIVPGQVIEKGLSFAPAEAKLTYDSIDIRFLKESLNRKRLQFDLRNVCIDYKEKALDTCFAELSGAVEFKMFLPKLEKIHPLRLISERVAVDVDRLGSDEAEEPKSDSNFLDTLRRSILPKWDFPGSVVELKKIEVVAGKNKFVTEVFLDAVKEGSTALHLKIPKFKEENSGFPRGNLSYTVLWPKEGSQDYESQGEFKIEPSATQALAINLETKSPSWEDIAYDLKAKINGIQPLNALRLNGHYAPAKTEGLFSLQLGGPQSQIKQVNFLDCNYLVLLNEKQGNLKCGPQQVSLALKERPSLKAKPDLFKMAPTFEFKVTNFSYEKGVKADVALSLLLEHLKFLKLDVKVEGNFDGSGKEMRYAFKTNSQAQVEDFAGLVRFLNDTPIAIPAPVNVMGGKVTLDIDGQVNEKQGEINFEFQPNLSSQHQRLLFTLGGRVELENRNKKTFTRLVLNSNLQNVKLSLPRLDLAAPPQLVPDGRFNLAKKREEESKAAISSGSTFDYDVDVTTPQVGSIAIATNLTKNPIPIGVDMNADSKNGLGPGEVEIGRVALELFRRSAHLEQLDVEFQPDGDKFLNGNLSIQYLDYDISIRVAGTVDAPKVIMESTPPLTQDQIVSVLLFGKAPDELDESQRASVGNVSTALADAALSFSSLYFLASTPIESVGYDAQRGVVTAKVGLGKGTSLELGSSGQDLSEVGVKRRLGQNWYLNSYVEEDSQTDERSVAAFIEWVRRF